VLFHMSVIFVSMTLLCSCATGRNVRGVDVMDENPRGQVIYNTRNCTNWDAERQRCNVKTCRQDASSDCQQFAAACLDTGHHYSGTKEGGT
jgi:hypothetical protein